jgi:hypothetical protein
MQEPTKQIHMKMCLLVLKTNQCADQHAQLFALHHVAPHHKSKL